MNETTPDGDGQDFDDLPNPDELPEIKLVGHSSLFYWWPVWLASIAIGIYGLTAGERVVIDDDGAERVVADSSIGLIFVAIMIGVIVVTNIRMRGLISIVVLLVMAVVGLLLAYLGLWDDLVALAPDISVHMNTGFYLFFGVTLMVIWAVQFFVFDRLVYYRVRPGQMIQERMIVGGEKSFDGQGMLFEQKDSDFFRHNLLGFGAGDLELVTNDARKAKITIPNVLFAERRVRQIQRLIVVKPDEAIQMRG